MNAAVFATVFYLNKAQADLKKHRLNEVIKDRYPVRVAPNESAFFHRLYLSIAKTNA